MGTSSEWVKVSGSKKWSLQPYPLISSSGPRRKAAPRRLASTMPAAGGGGRRRKAREATERVRESRRACRGRGLSGERQRGARRASFKRPGSASLKCRRGKRGRERDKGRAGAMLTHSL